MRRESCAYFGALLYLKRSLMWGVVVNPILDFEGTPQPNNPGTAAQLVERQLINVTPWSCSRAPGALT